MTTDVSANRPPSLIAQIRSRSGAAGVFFIVLAVTVLSISVVLLVLGKDPLEVLAKFLEGAFSTENRRADVIMTAVPTLLCASGLLLTFTAGLWNIGIEGQLTMGAVCAGAVALSVQGDTPNLGILALELIAAVLGGMGWALLAALLKTRAKVNEIFGGVALNFIATNILIYLVSGPWQAPGNTPTSVPFAGAALFPRVEGVRLSPLAIVIALVAFVIVFLLLNGTHFGLQLRAMGRSEKSAFILGVRTERNVIIAMLACGALAGLAGAVQTLFVRGRLVTGISGGVGFLGVLIVLLTSIRAGWVPIVALFFAVVPIGSQRLAIAMDLDSSLGNVFQSALVLGVLIANGIQARRRARQPRQ
jgi:simple sugar transport system permease protein